MVEIDKLIPSDAESTLIFFVNGKKVQEPNPDPEWTLLWYLRNKLQLTGTKYGCGEGGCGACTVMLSQYLCNEDRIKHIAINACLTPVCGLHGLAITTVEGIGSTQDRLHPVQERLAKTHGSQCGFCTPGIIMSMYTLLRNKLKVDYSDIETTFQGNLCRCTGYRPIIEGFKTFIDINAGSNKCQMGKYCCKNKETETEIQSQDLFDKSTFQPYDPSQEPIFPPELKLNKKFNESYLYYKGNNVIWIRPRTLNDLLSLKKHYPCCKIVVGNTEIGVEIKIKKKSYSLLVSPSIIREMYECHILNDGILIGASTSLTDINNILQKQIQENIHIHRCRIFKTILNMIHWFAGNQVRNVASLAGNIITASPISDLNPIFMASSAVLNVCSSDRGAYNYVINENFFKSYRKTVVQDEEIVVSIKIPFTETFQFFKAYKQSKRKSDDIAIVTAAFNVKFEENTDKIKDAKLCYGGVAETTICAVKTSQLLQGLQWNHNMLTIVLDSLTREINLDISSPGGMPHYRKSLCLSLFFKFYLHVLRKLNTLHGNNIPRSYLNATDEFPVTQPNSSQYFEIKSSGKKIYDTIGMPLVHVSAMKQTTGEAIYCDDIPHIEGEVFLCLIYSTESHAKIISVDPREALLVPGVVTFMSAADLDEDCNKMGPILKDEEIFTKEIVTSRACVVGAIIATSESVARKAKNLVKVTYEPLEPVIVTIEEAIAQHSFFSGYPKTLKKGNIAEAFAISSHVTTGYVRSGAQEHFYLETISAFAIRKEDELEIICTTQNPAEIAYIASKSLRIPNHKVIAKVKRIGGGFGGKETRAVILAIPVAIAAYKLNKPVRAVLERDEDMQITGYRHPCLINYKVAFKENGMITGAKFDIYSNAGNSMDISCAMMERAITHIDNCYFIPNIEVNGYLCKTNMPSNTAFRGFGAPKAMLAAETVIRNIANTLQKSYEDVININLYREGNLTHFNQILSYCTIELCWNECIINSNYWQRKKEIEDFNKSSRWKKKGITLTPTKYGISFQIDVLMQAGALLLIYNDGSVLISIGGIEMGQGLFTKMIQIASKTLEISPIKIHISEMSTDKVPNSSPTAASISSDLYGMAVINACNVLKERLEPYKSKNPSAEWEDWISAAYTDRVNLSATGFYAAPKIEYNREANAGKLFEYFTYGAACSEVIVDCLTGEHQVLRTDIVMDVGESLNPAIDIGQIEGAFIQGYGFYTMEEMVFSPNGEVLSKGPGTYKIPGFSDIPRVFNVSLLRGAPNPRAVYSSKAIGEPPLFLAASVYFAIKDAITSARLDAGVSSEFALDVPATCERIRMACEDEITDQVKPTITNNSKIWNVTA